MHGLLPLHVILVARTFAVACSFGCTDFCCCMQFWLYGLLLLHAVLVVWTFREQMFALIVRGKKND
nr:MAG TPA: hypothetical protein [Caudoviricetes sp.]